jgi:pSer/pThr/pTyr-binding forkhead associated (FHA) protein
MLCYISFEKEIFYLNDLNSNSGTYLDGNKIKPNSRCLLHSGQKVNFGHGISAKIRILSPHNSEKTTIEKTPLALLGNEMKNKGFQEIESNVQNDKESPQQIPSVSSTKGKHYQ